ncbi:MAG: hypothetical protein ACI4KF_01935 [Huintestinicola sp.]
MYESRYYDIKFTIEIDNEENEALFFSKQVCGRIDFSNEELQIELVDYVNNEEDDDETNYDFACEDFDDVTIYNERNITIDFCGIVVEDNQVYAKVMILNHFDSVVKLWAKDITIDDSKVNDYELIIASKPSIFWDSALILLENVDVETYYDIEFTIEINDDNDNVLDLSKRVKCHIDFPDEEISVELIDPPEIEINQSDESIPPYDFACEDFDDVTI